MGVLGLTTFIAKYYDKYKETVYLQNCPVVIDGPNLMYFLYFEARHSVLQASQTQKKGYRSAGSSGKSPVAKTNGLKEAYLFGGDYMTYVQNIREFFQQLKHCNITPIVLFDGAYDDFKIATAYKRFADNVKENVWNADCRVRGVTPGRSYAPVFIKVFGVFLIHIYSFIEIVSQAYVDFMRYILQTAFVEILQEQKILRLQTEGEADSTIAFVARKLGNCPILSSDSDFHMYVNAVVLPLHTLRFKKVTPKKAASTKGANKFVDGKIEKVWTLHSQFVSLKKLCDKQFKMRDQRLILLAAVILGNDYIPPDVFGKLRNVYSHHRKIVNVVKIASLLKWLGQQSCFDLVLDEMLGSVKEDQRTKVEKLVKKIISIYEGKEGEEYVWKSVMTNGKIDQFLQEDGADDKYNVEDLVSRLDLLDVSSQSPEAPDDELTSDLENSDSEIDADEDDEISISNTLHGQIEHNELISKMVAVENMNKTSLPEWYLECHVSCSLDTYLLKLIRNKTVFLTPQVETKSLPSSHAMSLPIIRVLGGILLHPDDSLTLVTRSKNQITEEVVKPIVKLPNYGALPNLYKTEESLRKALSLDQRRLLVLDTLGLGSPEYIQFIEEWPVSLRVWIMGVIYFIRKSKEESEEKSEFQDARKAAVSVAIAILISVLKNSVVNPPTLVSTSTLNANEKRTISQLLVENDSVLLSKLRKFYATYESFDDTSSRDFKRSYDIHRPYNFSQFCCILYHLSHLNRLLGDPFKAPKVSYSVNSWFIYKFSGTMNHDSELFDQNDFDYGKFLQEVTTERVWSLVDRVLRLC